MVGVWTGLNWVRWMWMRWDGCGEWRVEREMETERGSDDAYSVLRAMLDITSRHAWKHGLWLGPHNSP